MKAKLMNGHSHSGLHFCGPVFFFFFPHGFHQEGFSLCFTSLSHNFNINFPTSNGSIAPTVGSLMPKAMWDSENMVIKLLVFVS